MKYKLLLDNILDFTMSLIMAGDLFLILEDGTKKLVCDMVLHNALLIDNDTKIILPILVNKPVTKNNITANNYCMQIGVADIATETIVFYDKYFSNNGETITYKNGVITVVNEQNDYSKTDFLDLNTTAITHTRSYAKQYYKRFWDEKRSDKNTDWGTSWWYFETDAAGNILKQLEEYENGVIKCYSLEKNREDDAGGLGKTPLPFAEFRSYQIYQEDFDAIWIIHNKQHINDLLPKNKSDTAAVATLNYYSYTDLKPIIPELLTWLQDANWLVTRPITAKIQACLPDIIADIVPILNGDDAIWKYNILQNIFIATKTPHWKEIEAIIDRMIWHPTAAEQQEEVIILAREIYANYEPRVPQQNLFVIPDVYKIFIDNIVSEESPRYHDAQVFIVYYKYYSVKLTYLNQGDAGQFYELDVSMSNLKFYDMDDPNRPKDDGFYSSVWDYDSTLHIFNQQYLSLEAAAPDANFWLANYADFEADLLQNVSGFDTKINNSPDLIKNIIAVFEAHGFRYKQIYTEKVLNTANYKVLELKNGTQIFHIAVNNHKPYLACIKDFALSNIKVEFHNFPIEPSYGLQNIAFTFPKNLLELSLNSIFTAKISASERKQIQYWKAETIGEFLFNKWD